MVSSCWCSRGWISPHPMQTSGLAHPCLAPWTVPVLLLLDRCSSTLSLLISEEVETLDFLRICGLGRLLSFRGSWIQACLRAWSGVMRREGSHLDTKTAQHEPVAVDVTLLIVKQFVNLIKMFSILAVLYLRDVKEQRRWHNCKMAANSYWYFLKESCIMNQVLY